MEATRIGLKVFDYTVENLGGGGKREEQELALELRFDDVLSLDLWRAFASDGSCRDESGDEADPELSAFIEEKIAERAAAKKAKDFAKADAIRDELAGRGIVLKDTREGTTWERA